MRLAVLLPVLCICLISRACAEDSLRVAVDSAFAHGKYEQVELLVLRGERHWDALSAADRVQIALAAGYAMIMLGREAEAREYFRRALDADPATRLDPMRISPKFRMVFDEVKAAYRAEERQPREPVPPMVMAGPPTRAVLTNLMLPGSGQWLEGRRARGLVVLGVQAAAAGVFVWRMAELRDSRDAYLKETDRQRVRARYGQYESDYQTAWAVGLAAGAVYLASQVDLALSKRVQGALQAGLQPKGGEIGLCLRF